MGIFVICGYGLPKDIRRDQNYIVYLHIVFNRIYELASGQEAAIIPCGGPTNCEPPYQGTEADLIAKYLQHLMGRKEVRAQTSRWNVLPETTSLSTLENVFFAKQLIKKEGLDGPLTIFCEKTREQRLIRFTDHLFPNTQKSVCAVDFDISKNRYLDPDILQEKEERATEEGLWALQTADRMQKHHELFEKKFAFLRKRQSERLSHVDAVKEWFENEKMIIKELMPDHPFLQELKD